MRNHFLTNFLDQYMNRVYETDVKEELGITVYETEIEITTERKATLLLLIFAVAFRYFFLLFQ